MKRIVFAVIAVVIGWTAFSLSFVLWPNPPGRPAPPSDLMLFYALEGLVESLAFGVGVAFLIFGFRAFVLRSEGRVLSIATYLSAAWLLVNWWPHSNLHRVVGFEPYGLIRIEYAFHVTLVIAGAIVAFALARALLRAERPLTVGHGLPAPAGTD